MPSHTDVTVLVPTYGRPKDLRACLAALTQQISPPAEVLVVTRIDDKPSAKVAGSFAPGLSMRILHTDRPGQVHALNRGLSMVKTPFLAITDDDARPRPDWLARIVAHFSDPTVGAVGGRDIVYRDGLPIEGQVQIVGRVRWFGQVVGNHHLRGPLQDVHFIKGANMSYRRDLLQEFDKRLAGSGAQACNDMQVSLNVHRAGWRVIWDPEVIVDHVPGERLDEDGRVEKSWQAIADMLHNQTYTLLSLLPVWQRPLALAYALLVGTRQEPGPVLLPASLARTRMVSTVAFGFQVGLAGRLRGLRTFVTTRVAPGIWPGRHDQAM